VIICGVSIFNLWKENSNLKASDCKFRYLKCKTSTKASTFSTISDVAYAADALYQKDPEKMEQYVTLKEEKIKQAFEASEVAKQIESEKLITNDAAKKLKEESDSLTK
jgi:hypothetical protein